MSVSTTTVVRKSRPNGSLSSGTVSSGAHSQTANVSGHLSCLCRACNAVWRKPLNRPPTMCGACKSKDILQSVVEAATANPLATTREGEFGQHGHPILAKARSDAERSIYAQIHSGLVYDVGGQVGGLNRYLHRANKLFTYHALCPVTSAADIVRHSRLSLVDRKMMLEKHASYCDHTLSTCTCVVESQHCPRTFLFVHSFYYMTPTELSALCVGDRVYVVAHRFVGVTGTLPSVKPEFAWVRNDTQIEMSPLGHIGTSYSHRDTTPLIDLACSSGLRLCEGKYLYLSDFRSDGSTHVYQGVVSSRVADQQVVKAVPATVTNGLNRAVEEEMKNALTVRLSKSTLPEKRVEAIMAVAARTAAKHSVPVQVAIDSAERSANEALAAQLVLMRNASSNQAVHTVQLVGELGKQTELLPVFGPQQMAPATCSAYLRQYARRSLEFLSIPMMSTRSWLEFFGCSVRVDDVRVKLVNNETVGEIDVFGHTVSDSLVELSDGVHLLKNLTCDTVCLGYGDPTRLDPKHVLTQTERDCSMGKAAGATLLGWATGPSFVCRQCECNLSNALCNRHGVVQPDVTRDFTAASEMLMVMRPELDILYKAELDVQREAWIKKWPQIVQAAILLSQERDEPAPDRVKAFIKREGGHAKPTKARAIQAYVNQATKALFGPEFYSMQKAYTKLFDGTRQSNGIDITFSSGMNAKALGDWMRVTMEQFPLGTFYERDGKNWDATMQKVHLMLKIQAYFPAGAEFCEFVSNSHDVYGRPLDLSMDLDYKFVGTTKSGHNDTSLGNAIVNACIAYEAMVALKLRGRIIVNGDDLLVRVEGELEAAVMVAFERSLGIIPEARCFTEAESVTYLSGLFVQTEDSYAFIATPGRLLQRLFWTTKSIPMKRRNDWRGQVAASLLPVFRDVPVLREFIRGNLTGPIVREFTNRELGRDMSVYQVYNHISQDCAVAWLEKRYGFTETELDQAETFLKTVPVGPCLVRHGVLNRMIDVDCAEIGDREDPFEWDLAGGL